MNKIKILLLLSIFIYSCPISNINTTNSKPTSSINSNSIYTPKPTPSAVLVVPIIKPTTDLSKDIKEIRFLDKNNNLIRVYKENDELYVNPYYYYDFNVEVVYNNGNIISDVILKPSDPAIIKIDENQRIYTHFNTTGATSTLLTIYDKKTSSEITKVNLSTETPTNSSYYIDISGHIYDTQGNIITDTKIELIGSYPKDSDVTSVLISQPVSGEYILNYIRVGARLKMIVSKEGYKTQQRDIVLNFDSKIIDFGGENVNDKPFALEKL